MSTTRCFRRTSSHQARILEFPAYSDFAESFANTIPFSESIGFVVDVRDPDDVDMVTYVTAHEMGHQWWGHQVIAADKQGATMLIESFAQYSAMLTMERLKGPDGLRKFLKYELDAYLRGRGTEAVEELPLDRVEDKAYIHYRKGSVAMWFLADQLGRGHGEPRHAAVDQGLRVQAGAVSGHARFHPVSAGGGGAGARRDHRRYAGADHALRCERAWRAQPEAAGRQVRRNHRRGRPQVLRERVRQGDRGASG